ncbi:MAG TPA: potassium transporter TrkG, partial [Acetomicrobium sp.]|nr:potassium transporter TrkG [Acetomicrobium sp.]
MRFKIITNVLGLIVEVVSLFMLLPLGWAVLDKSPDVRPIFISMMIGVTLGAILLLIGGRLSREEMRPKEALVAVGLSWVLASAIGALPFWLSGAVPSFADAFFESVSGFTTTGATVLANIEANSRGILFWRSLTHWLGGMGIIVLGLAVLPFLGVGGRQLFRAEVPGPVPEKLTPRIHQTALLLWGVYVLLTALETLLLYLGGLSFFEALTHTFG